MKPYVKGTKEGKLYVDTKHPEWIKFFIDFIEKNKGRMSKYIKP